MPNPIDDLGYRYASVKYPGDGSTTSWNFSFAGLAPGYLDKSHVSVGLVGAAAIETPTAFTWVGPNTISVVPAVPVGTKVVIRRNTPKDEPLIDFTDGSILNENNLNTTTIQAIYSCAEMVDYFADLLDAFHGIDSNTANAVLYAQQALSAAQAAVGTANQALSTANGAHDIAVQAAAAAANALAIAGQALAAAQAAQASVSAAEQAAQAAQASADAANQAAQQALDHADQAQQSADQAQQSVGDITTAIKKMEFITYTEGKLVNDNEEVLRAVIGNGFTAKASQQPAPVLGVAPAANFSLNVQKNGAIIGDVLFLSGSLSGSFNFPNDIVFATNDLFSINIPHGDSAAESLSLTIRGQRS